MQRIAVVGTSCSGKSTLAAALAERLDCPHIELDAIHWGPNWTPKPAEEVRRRVDEATQQGSWTCCGNYLFLRDLIWQRADTIVWLDYSFPVIAGRALRRTIGRSLRREELWSGNRESLAKAFFSRDSILLWVLQTYRRHRREYPQLLAQPEHSHLRQVVLERPDEADRFLADLPARYQDAGEHRACDES